MTSYSPAAPARPVLVPEIAPFELYRSKRKQYGWQKKPVVRFRTNACEGISLTDALYGQTHDLLGRYDPVLEGCGDKVSFHIHVRDFLHPSPASSHPLLLNELSPRLAMRAAPWLLAAKVPKILLLPETRQKAPKHAGKSRQADRRGRARLYRKGEPLLVPRYSLLAWFVGSSLLALFIETVRVSQ
jgi:hypothetical protein